MKIGRRLAIKVLNASRFTLSFGGDESGEITEPLDRAMIASLADTVAAATKAFDAFDYARALEVAERSFWAWTDNYLELAKGRAYGDDDAAASAHAALRKALSVYLRLFAPFLPFVCDEVWSWWQKGSVHREPWPTGAVLASASGDPAVLEAVSEVLSSVRGAKSEAKVSMRTEVELLVVTGTNEHLTLVQQAERDLRDAARAAVVEYVEGEPGFTVKLATD